MWRFIFIIIIGVVNAAPNIQQLQFEVNNHEQELSTLNARVNSIGDTLEILREMIEKKKDNTAVQNVEAMVNSLVGDLQKLRTYSNEISDAMGKMQKKVASLEDVIEGQNRNIGNLQTAMKSILEAFDMKAEPGSYKVKSGDSLEKIANKLNTSVKALKEANGLKNDKIRIGQTLKAPS